MANAQVIHISVFQQALDDFQKPLSEDARNQIMYTTLEDLQRCISDIQNKHNIARRSRNMGRLKPFLEAMEQYGKVIEVFLNASQILCFVWVSFWIDRVQHCVLTI